MYGWGAVILVTAIFATLMLAIWQEVRRPLDDTDELCAQVDEDLDSELERRGWDPRVTHVWECPTCGMRVGFGGCTSAPPRCSGAWHAEQVEMEQVIS